MSRTFTGALGTVVLVVALSIGSAPAGATEAAERVEPRFRAVERDIAAAPAGVRSAPRRTIYSRVVHRNGRLLLRGDVSGWHGRRVVVQRKACPSCDWNRHEVVQTGDRGWFTSVIDAPRRGSTWWRARVGAADGYARTYSAVWETYY